MSPLSETLHVPPATSDSELSSLNVSASSVTTPDVPLAQLSTHPAHPRSHPPPYLQIFRSFPLNPPPPTVQQIGNYTLAELTNLYTKYKLKG